LCAQGEWHAITLDNIDMSSVVDDVSLPAPSSGSRRYEEFKKKNYEEFKKKFKEKQPVLPAEDESDCHGDEAYKAFKVARRNDEFKKATAVWQRTRSAWVCRQLETRWASMSVLEQEDYDDGNGEGDQEELRRRKGIADEVLQVAVDAAKDAYAHGHSHGVPLPAGNRRGSVATPVPGQPLLQFRAIGGRRRRSGCVKNATASMLSSIGASLPLPLLLLPLTPSLLTLLLCRPKLS
jgi:hypothetical protein